MRLVSSRSVRSALFILFAAFAVFALVFWPAVAFGQEGVQAIPPGEDVIVSVKKGEPSPISGQVFSTDTALRWGNWLEQYRVRLTLDVALERKLCETETSYQERVLAAEKKHAAEVLRLYQQEIAVKHARIQELEKEIESPPWYRTPEFGAALGAGATLGAVILGVVIVNSGSGG